MAEYTAVPIQTIAANNNVIFSSAANVLNFNIMHSNGSGIFTLRGPSNCFLARYKVSFGANIAVPTGETVGPISMAIASSGEPLLNTQRIVTPAAVEEYNPVNMETFIDVPFGCCKQIGIRNTSTIPINLQNGNLIIERVV